jgi:uncharacterized protein (DUF1810 family)
MRGLRHLDGKVLWHQLAGGGRAYFTHPLLGPRLIRSTETVLAIEGRSLHTIFGSPDDMTFHSRMPLFAVAVVEGGSAGLFGAGPL